MARDYELGIVINPDVGDEQARAVIERVTQVIGSNDGQVVRVNAVGRRRLAYPIERHRDGLYFFFDLILDPTSITEIERTLRVNEDIIRHLLLKRDPRVVTQQRQRDIETDARIEAERAAAAARAEAGESEAVAGAGQATATDQTGETPTTATTVPVATEAAERGVQSQQDEAGEAGEAGEEATPTAATPGAAVEAEA